VLLVSINFFQLHLNILILSGKRLFSWNETEKNRAAFLGGGDGTNGILIEQSENWI
jgi:hypothetical protein